MCSPLLGVQLHRYILCHFGQQVVGLCGFSCVLFLTSQVKRETMFPTFKNLFKFLTANLHILKTRKVSGLTNVSV